MVRYELNYFEKDGFKPPKRKDMHTINIGELADQVDQLRTERKAVKRRDGSHIDLEENGYHRLLGSGQISGPLITGVVRALESPWQELGTRKEESLKLKEKNRGNVRTITAFPSNCSLSVILPSGSHVILSTVPFGHD